MTTPILGHGCYNLSEAALYAGLPRRTVRRWFVGTGGRPPLFRPDYRAVDGDIAISFLNLVELMIAADLSRAAVPTREIRRVHGTLLREWGYTHPFAVVCFGILAGEFFPEFPAIYHCLPVIGRLKYDVKTGLANLYRPAPLVVLDPAHNFGDPTIEGTGMKTRILANAYHANGKDAAVVTSWLGCEARDVEAAVAFEAGLDETARRLRQPSARRAATS
jgi:uncharacterized protein (DUF433 family)